jgi:hypothetical protein
MDRLYALGAALLTLGGCATAAGASGLAGLEAKTAVLEAEVASLKARLGDGQAHAGPAAPVEDSRLTALYAPAPEIAGARSLFLAADLGRYPDRAAAEDQWRSLAAYSHFSGLEARYRTEPRGETTLLLGPFADRATVEAMCAQSMLAFKGCGVTSFTATTPGAGG